MGDRSAIEWCDATWNPLMRMTARVAGAVAVVVLLTVGLEVVRTERAWRRWKRERLPWGLRG